MKGLVHIYTGDGKGKTTASVGLCARFIGGGGKAAFYEFLKGSETGELKSLQRLNAFIYCPVSSEKFVFTMTEEERSACAVRQREALAHALENMGKYGLIVLDEVISAVEAGVLTKQELINFVKNKNETTELVLTGRGSFSELELLADYVSVISAKKHPYDNGVRARKGIEY